VKARAAAAPAALALAVAAGACGTPPPDLFVVERTGTVPGARLTLLVSDTSARCNRGPEHALSSEQILEARNIERELVELQAGAATPPPSPPARFFRFSVRTEEGTLRYGDTTTRPPVLPRLTRFVRRVAIDVCGLPR
jgi:hypothetical protein